MSAPDFLAHTRRGWNRDPAGVALGTARTGVSAALWTHQEDDVQEVDNGGAPLDTHIISVQCSRQYAEVFKDGRHCFSKGIQRGTVSWMEAGVHPRAVHRGAWSVLHLYVPPPLLLAMVREFGSEHVEPVDPECRHDPVIERIGRDVLAEIREGQPLSQLRIDALGQDLVIQLLRRWSNLAGTSRFSRELAKGGLAPWQVKRATEFMDDRLADDVSLEDLSQLLDLSTFHLCRAFKQSTGLPPHRWRMQRRIERARELLEGSDLPVTEIAAQVGYDDPSQLAAAFRKALGVSPSQYRRDRRG